MANPVANVPEYCGGLTRSRLLPGERVAMLYDAWRTRGNSDDHDVDGFRKFLVSGRHLTDYQAALVQRGHTDGFLIGGYVILDRVGKGHQSAGVYKAVHPASGQVVALKVLPGSKARNPHALARFQREGRLVAALDHPNVVRAFQVGSSGGAHFIVLEHLDGDTLDEVINRRKRLPAAEAARIVYQALLGLQHLHDKHMVHRDIKPANLMLTPSTGEVTLASTVKVLDIGLGRELFNEEDALLTSEGAMLGTPDYLAPEQARDARNADIRADIYAMGCVLYHLLTGHPPFVETSAMAAMVRHATEPPASMNAMGVNVPPELEAVLQRMLEKKPADRYQTPMEAAEALRSFVPANAAAPVSSKVIASYLQWLQTDPRDPGGSGPVSSSRVQRPGSGPMSSSRISRPMSSPMSSTRLNTGLGSGSVPSPLPPTQLKPPTVSPRLSGPVRAAGPRPVPASMPVNFDESDVELVPLEDLPQAPVVYTPPSRPLWDLDRRDMLMLGLGAGGVIAAVAVGIFVAKMNRAKIQDTQSGPDL
ncbi:hypothetical protein BH11PLA2_BH11PLA2_05370 [soil metagenome]